MASFAYMGQAIYGDSGVHIWLHLAAEQSRFPTDVILRASAEIYNTMLHLHRIVMNDHCVVFSLEKGVLHSVQISHVDFTPRVLSAENLTNLWQSISKARHKAPFWTIEMEFEQNKQTVYRCVANMNWQQREIVTAILNAKVESFAPLVRYESRKAIVILT